ncbi:MAG: hypothetical protein HYT61_00100 [Candidatus Yanofskybacteria bacterium]|nr:hypothetical protein [Candidatus Yanofskybacteria bacterium]
MLNKKYKKLYVILAVIIILAVFVPQHEVKAVSLCPAVFRDCVIGVQEWMMELVGKAIGWAANLLDVFLQNQPISGVFVVDQGWTTVRNFVNLFFILALIIMAFGTIFDIKKYTWRDMLPGFIIAALLVNFSLAIGQYIAGVANGLSGVFLREIGQTSVNAAQGSGIQKLATTIPTGVNLLGGTASVAISGIFALIFLIIVFLAFLSVAIFSIVRLVAIWFLLIISPIAWLGYALPNLRSQTANWWKHFLCWCFFLPYYLFFMTFAVIFVRNKNQIGALLPTTSGGPIREIFGSPGAINDFLFYILSLIFLVGGLALAMKLACASGTYVRSAFGVIESRVRKYAPGAAYVRGAKEGLKERVAEIQEKGMLGIGGAQRARIQEATAKGWIAGIPGKVPGATEEASRAKVAEVDKEIKRLQLLNLTLDQLNIRLKKAGGPEKIAALKLKAENGWLEAGDLGEINKTIREAGGGRNALGASIIQSLKKGKFHEMAQTTAQKEFIFNNLEDVGVKKEFGLNMAESREIMNETIARQLLELYSGDMKEVQDKVAETVKKNIDNFAKDKSAREAMVTRVITPTTTRAEKKIMELAAKTMVEKKEVNSWSTRRSILQLTGGIDPTTGDALTVEGRTLAKEIKDNNTLFKEEMDYRASHGILPAVDLTPAQRTDVQRQIETNISNGLIRGLSAEEMKTPEIFNSINSIMPNIPTAKQAKFKQELLGKGADRRKREAFDKAALGPPIPY